MKNTDIKDIQDNLHHILSKFNQEDIKDTVVYTAIFGGFDSLSEVRNPKSNVCYICFTDQEDINSKTWKIVKCEDIMRNPRLFAKFFKIFPHKIFRTAKTTLWVDGNYLIKSNHWKFLNTYDDLKHIKFYRHSLRNCIYDEAETIKKEKPEFNPKIISRQIDRYIDENMPANQGLINGAIILRNHESKLLPKLMDEWWFEIYNYSIRDQLSFNYVNWKNGNCVEYFPEEITSFIYFKFKPHLGSTNANILLKFKISIKSLLGSMISYVRSKR